jgi:hypothetical protein
LRFPVLGKAMFIFKILCSSVDADKIDSVFKSRTLKVSVSKKYLILK